MTTEKPRRSTRQRRLVLEELRKLKTHPTAAELHEIARRRLPKISLGTVYRNLKLLSRTGLVRKLESDGGGARFEGNDGGHYHVRCIQCARVDDVGSPSIDPAKTKPRRLNGYKVLGYRLEFIGVCPVCQRRSRGGGAHSPRRRRAKMKKGKVGRDGV